MYVSGRLVEFWEDPDHPFGCAQADLQGYLDREAWVLLFNALSSRRGLTRRTPTPGRRPPTASSSAFNGNLTPVWSCAGAAVRIVAS
jgi:hypothetical protein